MALTSHTRGQRIAQLPKLMKNIAALSEHEEEHIFRQMIKHNLNSPLQKSLVTCETCDLNRILKTACQNKTAFWYQGNKTVTFPTNDEELNYVWIMPLFRCDVITLCPHAKMAIIHTFSVCSFICRGKQKCWHWLSNETSNKLVHEHLCIFIENYKKHDLL